MCCSIMPGKRRHLVQRILGVNASTPVPHTGYESTASPVTDTASPSTASEGPHSPFSTSSWGSYASSATSASMLSVSSKSCSDHRYQTSNGNQLAAYIKPLPARLSRSEYDHLEATGCFNLPEAEARKEVVETYMRGVHPTLPMIDPSQLRYISAGGTSAHQVSLLLFKSVELAASLCSQRRFYDAGDLVRQIEALLKANVENEPLAMLQALILLTFSDGDNASTRDSYHWMGIASKYAARLLSTGHLTNDKRKSVRATLWSLVVRDSIVALAARRSPQVNIELSSALLSLPTEDDWFCPTWCQPCGGLHGIESRELCRSLHELCEAARSTLDVKLSQGSSIAASSPSRHLRLWYSQWHRRLSRMACQEGEGGSVHGAVILAYWSLAVMTLHCWSMSPQATPSVPADPELVPMALATTTAAYSRLHEQSKTQYVPNTAVAALVPAAVAHLMNSTAEQRDIRAGSSQKYYLCWQVLRELRSKYRTAHQAMRMLDSLGQDVRQKIDTGNIEHGQKLRDWCNRAAASGMVCG